MLAPMLSFGVTVLPDPPYSRFLELIKLAESHGFEYAWTYDSHVLWQESFPLLAVAARETSNIKLGHFVTNPARAIRRCSRVRTRRCMTFPTDAWRWASAAATPPCATSASSR